MPAAANNDVPHVCFDRVLTDVVYRPQVERIALMRAKLHPPGTKLRVYLAKGFTEQQQKEVKAACDEIKQHANILFEFVTKNPSEIRVTFNPRLGAWSYIGTDILGISQNEPTMNLGFNQPGTYLHEFLHAMGAIHEHQNPMGGIKWNKEQVYRDLSGPPNNWDRQTIEHNMFEAYSRDQLNGTEVDPKSIMMYAIPARWTLDGFHTEQNGVLSEQDKKFLRTVYPFDNAPGEPGGEGGGTSKIKLPLIDLDPLAQEIGQPGERDFYEVALPRAGHYRFEALGPTATVIRVYGPNSETNLVGQTNSVGMRFHVPLDLTLAPGRYFALVTHADPMGVGKYSFRVLRFADNDPLADAADANAMVVQAVAPVLPGRYTLVKQGG